MSTLANQQFGLGTDLGFVWFGSHLTSLTLTNKLVDFYNSMDLGMEDDPNISKKVLLYNTKSFIKKMKNKII